MKNVKKNTSTQARMLGLQDIVVIHLTLALIFWLNQSFKTSEEREASHDYMQRLHEEQSCHLYEQQLEYWKEHLKKFENAPLQSGTMSTSQKRTDKLSRKKVQEVGYGITPAEIAEAKRFGILPSRARLPASLTKAEADAWFEEITLPTYAKCVDSVCKMELSMEQRLSLISFTHNLGTGNLKKLLKHKPSEIGNAMRKYCYANGKKLAGLERRRGWEAEMWEIGLKKSAVLASR